MDITTPQHVPLSVGQEAMWVGWKLDPEQWTHIIPTAFLVRGEIDRARLERAVTALGEAYPQLRGRVRPGPQGPVLDWSDAPGIPVRERTTDLDRDDAVRRTWQVPFDLRQGPLARVDLLHGPGYTVLLMATHHLVYDGASVLILLEALRECYAGNPPAPVDQVPALAEFATRSRELADGPAGEEHRAHWRKTLASGPLDFALPTSVDVPGYTVLSEDLPPDLVADLRDRAAEAGVSYVTVLLAGYFALLRRHCRTEEVLAFVPYHGRSLESLRDRVGYFVNALPIRGEVRGSDTYATLIQRVRGLVKDALRHGDLPLPAIMREAGLTGPEARARTHQTVFQYWHAGLRDGVDVQDLVLDARDARARLSLLDLESTAGFTLAVMVREDSAGTHVLWKDPTGSVGPTVVAELAADYRRVLREIARDPGATLIDLAEDRPGRAEPREGAGPVADGAGRAATEAVAAMVDVWQDVLGIDDIRTDDSFFELGGHSLLAETLVLAAGERLGVDVSIRTLFDFPRLAEFTAEVLGSAVASPAGEEGPHEAPPVVPELPGDAEGEPDGWRSVPHRMSVGIRRQQGAEGEIPSESIICKVYYFRDLAADEERLQEAFRRTLAVNPALGSRYRVDPVLGPQYREEPVDYPVVRFVTMEASATWDDLCAEAQRTADAEMAGRLDLREGRLLRVVCVRLGGRGFALVVKADHTVCDGLSFAQLLRDVGAAYAASTEGAFLADRRRPSPAEVEAAEGRVLGGQQGRELRAAWRKKLPAGVPEVLLRNATRWQDSPPEGDSVHFSVRGDAYRRHTAEAQNLKVTSFALAAAKVLFAMRPSILNDELCFFCPFPGRFVPEAKEVLGNFVNLLPVLVEAPREAGPADMVRAVREGLLWTLQHQGLPFDEVMDEIRDVDATGEQLPRKRRALFMAGNQPEGLRLDGTAGETRMPEMTDALFDFSLWVTDTGEELNCGVVYRRAFMPKEVVEDWLEALNRPLEPALEV
ncbi:condensation domain-containing protein [Streptomyces sp. NPDC059928]|uniref:condensation domain-containing protein n=1 Tax=unclassified Streptomyces TaxID=2593676 RepID=UPI00365D5B0F